MDHLRELSRKDLQKLAKQYGIKANKKSHEMIEELAVLLSNELLSAPTFMTKDFNPEPSSSEERIETEIVAKEPSSTGEHADACVKSSSSGTEELIDKELVVQGHYSVGELIEACVDDRWTEGTIKRLNKKSVRVLLHSREQVTLPYESIRRTVVKTSDVENSQVAKSSDPSAEESVPQVDEHTSDVVKSLLMEYKSVICNDTETLPHCEIEKTSSTFQTVTTPIREIIPKVSQRFSDASFSFIIILLKAGENALEQEPTRYSSQIQQGPTPQRRIHPKKDYP